MIHTLKTSLLKQPQHFITSPLINSLRFIQSTPKSNQQQQQSMDESQTQEQKDQQEKVDKKSATESVLFKGFNLVHFVLKIVFMFWFFLLRDVMSHSFGQGYKTRSDEEGFGGIYGTNQSDEEEEVDVVDVNHVLHLDYDKSQGSEVKEKEKARNQMETSS